MRNVQTVAGTTPVEIWAQDECRLGLKPILRRVWTKCGQRPQAVSQIRYEWTYVYGFVRPTTGETHWLILPHVSKEYFEIALNSFAERGWCREKEANYIGSRWRRLAQELCAKRTMRHNPDVFAALFT